MPQDPCVDILMGVHNGAQHLPAQLASIAAQSHGRWRLICSDDGATDDSMQLIWTFARDHPNRVSIRQGPGRGFAENYLSMIAGHEGRNRYVSLADQDDIWHAPKLGRAITRLAPFADQPALYCGRRTVWWPQNGQRRNSPRRVKPCNFRNALVENVAGGNTIVLNPMAARLAQQAARRVTNIYAHDWFLYLLLSGAGGRIVFDNGPPQILYRQHGDNAVGAAQGPAGQIRRKNGVLQGEFRKRIGQNLLALSQIAELLTPQNRQYLSAFCEARDQSLLRRITRMRRVGPFRHDLSGTIGFWGAAVLGKV